LKRPGLAAAVLWALALPAGAHDFWIEPSSFRPPVPSQIRVALRVGQDFRGDPVPRDDRKIQRFVLVGAGRETPIPGLPAVDPAGFARIEASGLSIIAYRSDRYPLTLEASKFEEFLREEGLERILAIREARGETQKPDREVFSRCAKSLLAAGGDSSGSDRPLGLTLELVAEKNPARLSSGQMPVRLVYEGKPLEGALVVAMNQAEPEKKLKARSGRDGRVSFALGKGIWLVKAVHMFAATGQTDVDWESLWASLTFEVP
jgi:uncharacterized GH25 family protein